MSKYTVHRSPDGMLWTTLGEYRATSPMGAVELARKTCLSGARYWKTLGRTSNGKRINRETTFEFCR